MNLFDKLCPIGLDNYGIITTADAKALGISDKVMSTLVKSGRLSRRGYGVFKLAFYSSSDGLDRYAEAVALAGRDARVNGESVLAMLNLALVNPATIEVASPYRVRRTLPPWVRFVRIATSKTCAYYRGIPCQPLVEVLQSGTKTILPERLSSAVETATSEGWLSCDEAQLVKLTLNRKA